MMDRIIEVLEEVLDLIDPTYDDVIEEIEDILMDIRK